MKKTVWVTIVLIIAAILFVYSNYFKNQVEPPIINNLKINNTMKLESTAFENSESIPSKYTCDGENINPPFIISGVPEGTKSLALIADDPDAPRGTWVHWLVWNIKPDVKEISENSVPQGAVEGITSFGKTGYGGPCPPSGIHRYFFKIYAVDKLLDISNKSKVADLEKAMNGHVLGSGELMGRYEKR